MCENKRVDYGGDQELSGSLFNSYYDGVQAKLSSFRVRQQTIKTI